MKAVSVPSIASTDMAATTSAAAASRSASSSARAPTAVITWVPLISASPSFGASSSALDVGQLQRHRAGHPLAAQRRLALADQDQRQVGERRQVAGGADRSLARHDRVHAGVEQLDEALDHDRPDPGVPPGEHVGAEQEHGAHDVLAERLAHPAGVGAQQVELQPGELVGGDLDVGEPAEAGVDAVQHLARRDPGLDARPGAGDPLARPGLELDTRPTPRDGLDLFHRETPPVQHDWFHPDLRPGRIAQPTSRRVLPSEGYFAMNTRFVPGMNKESEWRTWW